MDNTSGTQVQFDALKEDIQEIKQGQRELVAEMKASMERFEKIIMGNGTPGLKDQVVAAQRDIDQLTREWNSAKKAAGWLIALGTAGLLGLLWQVLVHQSAIVNIVTTPHP